MLSKLFGAAKNLPAIAILVGTEYGNASEVARVCAERLRKLGARVRVTEHASLYDLTQDPQEVLLICTSTTGSGDLPGNLMTLYDQLQDQPPRLAGRRYGIIGLGDSSYDHYNNAARRIDGLLSSYGAVRVGDPCLIDALLHRVPEPPAEKWLNKWLKLL